MAHGDSFFVVIVADTTRLFRVRDGDTRFVSYGYATGLARDADRTPGEPADGEPAEGRPAGGMIAIAIPDRWEPDSAAKAAGDAAAQEPDTLPIHAGGPNSTFEAYAADEVSAFLTAVRGDARARTSLTAADWRERHPEDRLEPAIGEAARGWRYDDFAGRWCDPSPNCPDRPGFRRVIQGGEAFLDDALRRDGVDPELLAKVHRRLADAYADIVALDAGMIPEAAILGDMEGAARRGPDETRFARRRAVQHYQSALDLMPRSAESEAIWGDAWRLTAGLPPIETSFVCSWD